MAIKIASHLYRNRFGVFYFRVVVPRDLQRSFCHREIHRSLRTGLRREAVSRVMLFAAHVTDLFRKLRAMPKKNDEPLQIDMVESMDLSEFGLPPHKWDFDSGNPDDVALVEMRRQELLKFAAEHGRIAVAVSDIPESKTLSELFSLFCIDKRATKQWKDPDTAEKYDYGPHINAFIEVVGDKAISKLTADDVRQYKSAVLGRENEALGNKQKRLTCVKTLLNWTRRQHHTDKDYSGILKLEGGVKVRRSYEPFTPDDLSALFHSTQYQQHQFTKASQYWLPLIGLYTGGRINELAQLHTSDIREVDGIAAIDINDDEQKTTKNESSIRTVPIHPELHAAGLMHYVDAIRAEEYQQLFPELKKSTRTKDSFGKEPSRFFTKYRRKLGVISTDERFDPTAKKWLGRGRKVFHSLRATANSMLRREEVPQERRERLVGHESEGANNSVYRPTDKDEMFRFQTLYNDLCKLDYGLKHPPYVPTDAHRKARLNARATR